MTLALAPSASVRVAMRILLCLMLATMAAARADDTLRTRINDPQRGEANRARDVYRHPYETLSFFGLRDDETIVEIWPGGGAWWTEILAPWLHDHGHYVAALPPDTASDEALAGNKKFAARLASDAQRYGATQVVSFPGGGFVAPNSADAILTFRNLHNWMAAGKADAAFAQFYAALKPGGVLGIEDHRARTDLPEAAQLKSGYVREETAIARTRTASATQPSGKATASRSSSSSRRTEQKRSVARFVLPAEADQRPQMWRAATASGTPSPIHDAAS